MPPRPTHPSLRTFGGASRADARAIRHAVGIIRGRPRPTVRVVSAPALTTGILAEPLAPAGL